MAPCIVRARPPSCQELWADCASLTPIRSKARTAASLASDKLLVGFSRQAAGYKRSDRIFTDPDQITPDFEDGRLQLVFSGKAHPLDDGGKSGEARRQHRRRVRDAAPPILTALPSSQGTTRPWPQRSRDQG